LRGESFKSTSFSVTQDMAMFDWPHYYDVPINKGDRICIEFGVRYKGYRGGLARNIQVGPLTEELRRLDEAVTRAQEAAVSVIKPGIGASDVIKAANRELEKHGYKPTIDMAGHGMGLTPQEPPMIEATNEMQLEEGMTLAVEVWQMEIARAGMGSSDLGVFGGEDVVVVTKDGCDELTNPPLYRDEVRCVLCDGTR